MSELERYLYPIAAGASAMLLCFSVTWYAKRLAWRIGAVDRPGEARRMQDHPIPRAGGLAVFVAFLLGTAVFCPLSSTLLSLWAGGSLLFLVGLIDDVLSVGVWSRLAAQLAAALIAVVGTGRLDLSDPTRLATALFAVLWMVALTNAHNFVDGIDGLCAKLGITESLAIAFLQYLTGDGENALAMLLLAGALLGFLPLGRAPARLFLGDCGSTVIGYLTSALSLDWLVRSSFFEGGDSMVAPVSSMYRWLTLVLLFSVPLADLLLAVLRRLLGAGSPFQPDRRHLHHLLVDSGESHESAGVTLTAIAALFALVGISLQVQPLLPFSSLGCVAAALFLVWVWRRMTARRRDSCQRGRRGTGPRLAAGASAQGQMDCR